LLDASGTGTGVLVGPGVTVAVGVSVPVAVGVAVGDDVSLGSMGGVVGVDVEVDVGVGVSVASMLGDPVAGVPVLVPLRETSMPPPRALPVCVPVGAGVLEGDSVDVAVKVCVEVRAGVEGVGVTVGIVPPRSPNPDAAIAASATSSAATSPPVPKRRGRCHRPANLGGRGGAPPSSGVDSV
jgi:hypothetical protein